MRASGYRRSCMTLVFLPRWLAFLPSLPRSLPILHSLPACRRGPRLPPSRLPPRPAPPRAVSGRTLRRPARPGPAEKVRRLTTPGRRQPATAYGALTGAADLVNRRRGSSDGARAGFSVGAAPRLISEACGGSMENRVAQA